MKPGGRKFAPDGHFYSPITNADELRAEERRIWPEDPTVLGIPFNDSSHSELLTGAIPRFTGEYDYPNDLCDDDAPYGFFNWNDQFTGLDSRVLFAFLRHFRPARMFEVGSGFSSLLVADVNRRFLELQLDFRCIEPYPRQFLIDGVSGVSSLVRRPVQDVPASYFDDLQEGDILFIDTSHVAKTWSGPPK